MTWAIVSSWSCFCWLYRAFPSLAAKNIINLILVLTIWWCPRVESSLFFLEESVFYDQCILLAKLCPVSFCTPRSNLPVTPSISSLPTLAFQSPIMKKTSFLGVSSKRSCRLHRTVQLSFFSITSWGIGLDYCDIQWFALETNRDHSVVFEIASKYYILESCWIWWLLHFF